VGLIPSIDDRLVAELAKKFPDQAPSLDLSDKEVWFRAGQVSVVRYLKKVATEQDPFAEEVS
jgi:hypothetical protein